MAGGHTDRLLEYQKARQAAHQHRPHHRSDVDFLAFVLNSGAVALERSRHRLALFFAKTLGVVSDFGPHLLAVIGQCHEFHGNTRERGIGAEAPQCPQRLRQLQHLRMHLEPFFRPATEDFQKQLFHGPEVVVHQLRLQPGPVREAARRHRGIALLEHQLLGGIEQQDAVFRVRRPDSAGRCHVLAPYCVPSRADHTDRIVARRCDLDPDITAMLSRCSAYFYCVPSRADHTDRIVARRCDLDPDITAMLSRCSAHFRSRNRAAVALAAEYHR